MSPRYRALLTAHITQRAELDFIKRAGHETGPRGEELKAVPRERIQRGEDIRRELQELERKADREFAELDGFKGMQKKIDIIENKFAEMFDRAHEAGLFGPETYQILKDYKDSAAYKNASAAGKRKITKDTKAKVAKMKADANVSTTSKLI